MRNVSLYGPPNKRHQEYWKQHGKRGARKAAARRLRSRRIR